jgi:hypothetical protein
MKEFESAPNNRSKLETRYHIRLRDMPAPGQGRHTALLGIANLGILAGIEPEQIHDDIRRAVNGGSQLPDNEIRAAILKAALDHGAGSSYRPTPKPAPLIKDGQAALRRIIDQGTIRDDADLVEASPLRLLDQSENDPVILLKTLFKPNEFVFIGDRLEPGIIGRNVRTAAAWDGFFKAGGKAGPFIIVNPLTGIPAPKKTGNGDSLRCDGSISTFRHCLVEFDNIPREDQIKFWSAAKLSIVALIDSGGKSIHAWLDVQKLFTVTTAAQWDQNIRVGLYEQVLVPLGVDQACCNPSRLSRLPGHYRSEKEKFQRLLWLAPEGREVVR